jgi:membrane-associated protease RseP (regulator of RpoE activity)
VRASWRASLAIGLGLTLASSAVVAQVAPVRPPAPAASEPVPWLGITFDGDPAIRVVEVYPGTGAARAGIAAGDLVEAVDGIPVMGALDLQRMVRRHAVGDRIVVDVHRDGRNLRLMVKAGAMPPMSELLELRLVGSPLPYMEAADLHAGARLTFSGRAAVLVVFTARCEPCGGAASRVAEALAGDGGLQVTSVIAGSDDEVTAYLRRVPVLGAIARWERPTAPGSVLANLSADREGAILVVDAKGVVQFAASTADLDEIEGGVRAAAARCQARGRRSR